MIGTAYVPKEDSDEAVNMNSSMIFVILVDGKIYLQMIFI